MTDSKSKLIQFLIYTVLISSTSLWLYSCAPLPPIVETQVIVIDSEFTGPELSKVERDSIILVRSSFAYEYYKNGDYESAREHYKVIYQYDLEHNKNIFKPWADCFVRAGIMDSALFAYEEGVKYFPDDAYFRNSLAIMYRNSGKYEDAIVQQKEAIRIKPGNIDYIRALADLYEMAENWDEALVAYKKLAELLPGDEAVRNRIVNITRAHMSPAEYIKTLKEAVEQFPEDARKRFDYARALSEQGQYIYAEGELRKYTEMMPDDPSGWEELFIVRQNLDDHKSAIVASLKIIELHAKELDNVVMPDLAKVFTDAGGAYLSLKNWRQARSYAYKALSVKEGYGPAYVLLGNIYYQAADVASGSSPKYNDKLVYTIAYGLYRKAATSSDPEAGSDGERWMSALKGGELIPSKEELFMHVNDKRPKGDKYNWIKTNWQEVKYIDSYLKTLN